jgi:hypothetical protein
MEAFLAGWEDLIKLAGDDLGRLFALFGGKVTDSEEVLMMKAKQHTASLRPLLNAIQEAQDQVQAAIDAADAAHEEYQRLMAEPQRLLDGEAGQKLRLLDRVMKVHEKILAVLGEWDAVFDEQLGQPGDN